MPTVRTFPSPVNALRSPADVRSGALAPSKTHDRRGWAFVPADPTAPHDGTVTVTQGRLVTSYLVAVSDDGSEVLFAKADGPETYAVRLTNGIPARCTCPGFRFAGHCKHRDAAREVLATLAEAV